MAVKESGSRGGIQSLHRAFDIMEAVSAQGSMGTTEIAHAVGLAVSTVQNLCRTMASRGYLIGVRGTYRLGPGISVFASRWDPFTALPDLIKPELQRIGRETGQSASATVLVGGEARLLAFEPGESPVTVQVPQWTWPDALMLATGRVLVALTQQDRWPDFIQVSQETQRTRDPSPEPSIENWTAELDRIAATAVSTTKNPDPKGQTAIAVPVWGTGETVICAIGSSAPTFLADEKLTQQMATAVVDASRRISASLGVDEPRLPDAATATNALTSTT